MKFKALAVVLLMLVIGAVVFQSGAFAGTIDPPPVCPPKVVCPQ